MKRCPISYELIDEEISYSPKGLKCLSPRLKFLGPLNMSAKQQREEAINRVGKISIQGVQLKLSAKLNIKEACFELVDAYGHYILKPQSEYYPELPENEAITMTLAAMLGIEVPLHGLLYCQDKSMSYFVKRFDRTSHQNKLNTEDFSQLSNMSRDTKYDSSMEKIVRIIESFCTFPKLELLKLLKITLFNFLIGNEDMHLKNFSLITREKVTGLSPAYDLLNTTIAQRNTKEELALPLHGKKSQLSRKDFLEYFAIEKLKLNQLSIDEIMIQIQTVLPDWRRFISYSFLSKEMQAKYLDLLEERATRLGLN